MNFFVVALFGFFLAVQASPLLFAPRAKLDVFVPVITSPSTSTVWCIGQSETVEWYVISSHQKVLITEKIYDSRKTDNAPVNISNGAAIFLGCPDNCTESSLFSVDHCS